MTDDVTLSDELPEEDPIDADLPPEDTEGEGDEDAGVDDDMEDGGA